MHLQPADESNLPFDASTDNLCFHTRSLRNTIAYRNASKVVMAATGLFCVMTVTKPTEVRPTDRLESIETLQAEMIKKSETDSRDELMLEHLARIEKGWW